MDIVSDANKVLAKHHILAEELHTIFLAVLTSILTIILFAELFPSTSFQIFAGLPSLNDDFAGSALSGGWVWENPSNNSSYLVAGGVLRMTAAKGDDQWIGINKASKILRNQRTTPWSIETKISANTGLVTGQNFAGLAVFADGQNWLIWGQLGNKSLEASGVIGNAFTQVTANSDTKFNYLRIRRVGSKYYFDASNDGTNWTNINVWEDKGGFLNSARYGFIAKDWSVGSGASYSISFDYFREYPEDLMPSALTGTTNSTLVAKEVGSGAVNNTSAVDICGTDLGSMFDWSGKTYFAFGDTSKCPLSEANLDRSNVLASSTDSNITDGLSFDSWITSGGRAKELFSEDLGTVTAIPTHGVAIGSTGYLFYMQVTNWGIAGNWSCNYSSIATSTDGGQNWIKKNSTIQWGPGNFNQVAIIKQDPYLYIWGIPCGRNGSVRLMRVDEANILNKSSYQYFAGFDGTGNPVWSSNETSAITVAGGPTGEISVIYNPWLARYLMTYFENYSGKIVVRESIAPWGPWSAPLTITNKDTYPALYGAYMKANYWENNGETVYFMMSRFFPEYSTYWMKTTLVRNNALPTPTPTVSPTPVPIVTKATSLKVLSQQCVSDGVKVSFSWIRAGENTTQVIDDQWLDLSLSNNNFASGTFTGTSDPPSNNDNSYTTSQLGGKINSLLPSRTYYWRINTHYKNSNWSPSVVASFTTPSCIPVSATNLNISSQQCVTGGVKVNFSWSLADPKGKLIEAQYLDLSTVNSIFNLGTFIGAALGTSQNSYISQAGNPIGPLVKNKLHYWRINTRIAGTWYPSVANTFTTQNC